jgi:hypothetical protein
MALVANSALEAKESAIHMAQEMDHAKDHAVKMAAIDTTFGKAYESEMRDARAQQRAMEDIAKMADMHTPFDKAYESAMRETRAQQRAMEDFAKMADVRAPFDKAYESAMRETRAQQRAMEDFAKMAAVRAPFDKAYESAMRETRAQQRAMEDFAKMAAVRAPFDQAYESAIRFAGEQSGLMDAVTKMAFFGSPVEEVYRAARHRRQPNDLSKINAIAQFENLTAIVSELASGIENEATPDITAETFGHAQPQDIVLLVAQMMRDQIATKEAILGLAAAIKAQPGVLKLFFIGFISILAANVFTHFFPVFNPSPGTGPTPQISDAPSASTKPTTPRFEIVRPAFPRTGPSRRARKLPFLFHGRLVLRIDKRRRWSKVFWFDIFLRPNTGWIRSSSLRQL